MGKTGLKNRLGNPRMKKIGIMALILVAIAAMGWGGWRIFMDDTDVNFRVLNEGEIPQQIASQVIPEYRQLERALACVVDGKVYVIATRGEKPTSGYEINIDRMALEDKDEKTTLVVFAKFKDPEPGMALTQALTYPLQVAETELTSLPNQIQLKVQYVD